MTQTSDRRPWVEPQVTPRPSQAERVREYFERPPTPYAVGVDVASGVDHTALSVVRRSAAGLEVVEVSRVEPAGRSVRQLWRRVRRRHFVRAEVVYEPRDWWAGLYGPTPDVPGGVVHLYLGVGLPWVLRLTFDGGGWLREEGGRRGRV